MSRNYVFGLCEGRHPVPATSFIFPGEIDPTDFTAMTRMANDAIPADAEHIDLYVTGLTAGVLAVVSVCEARKIGLTAYHYDRQTGNYLPQVILHYFRCGFCGKPMSGHDMFCPHCGAT